MTPFIKKKDIKKDWYIINAQNAAVGRLAAYISKVLRGKNKTTFNPHIDNGDFVVVTNIDKIKFTGKKFTDKKYYKIMSEAIQSTEKPKKIKLDFKNSKYATGRRKRSIAKVWVKKGSGNIHVNGLKMNEYFKRPVHQIIVTRPLEISEVVTNYDVKCSVKGGGLSGQAGAIILGISKALISHDENLKNNLKKDKLTTRDSRVVERKKYGHRKARRSFQFSKR